MKRVAKIKTSRNTIIAELFEMSAPESVRNFINLALDGFYDGLEFFKVIPGVLVQSGCPNNDGSGHGPRFIDCEIENELPHEGGSMGMAHTLRDMNSSQFYISLDPKECSKFDGNNTVFGKVVSSITDVQKIREGDRIEGVEFEMMEDDDLSKLKGEVNLQNMKF